MGMYPLEKLASKNEKDIKHNACIEEYLAKRLIQIIHECRIHEHTTYNNNGHLEDNTDYYMSYPQPIFYDIAVYLDEYINKEA